MDENVPNDATIRSYLLGQTESEVVIDRIDELMLDSEEFSENVDVIEDEIIEEYVEGTLSPAEKKAVESHFLRPQERQRKLQSLVSPLELARCAEDWASELPDLLGTTPRHQPDEWSRGIETLPPQSDCRVLLHPDCIAQWMSDPNGWRAGGAIEIRFRLECRQHPRRELRERSQPPASPKPHLRRDEEDAGYSTPPKPPC